MKKHTRQLSSIIDNEARDYAMYTIENRAIPNMIDGLKPVQRFFLYSSIQNAKTEFRKIVAIAGRVSEYGYHHGEGSASDAGQLMANTWNNNFPIIQGRGNFGSRLVQKAAAPRYTFAKLHDNFWKVYKDLEVCPEHEDPEHLPPRFYLPIIPTVLLNGVKGIATGFATSILPHSLNSVKQCVTDVIKTGNCKEPEISYPDFNGKVTTKDDKMYIEGIYELSGQTTLYITEVPYKYDREAYIKLLDKLDDDGEIVRYSDDCDKDGFKFEVKLRRGTDTSHEAIVKMFALRQGISQNLTVIGPDGLRQYDKASDLIKDFVEIRKHYIDNRIKMMVQKTKDELDYMTARHKFISLVIDGTINLKEQTKAKSVKQIQDMLDVSRDNAEKLVSMPLHSITTDTSKKIEKDMKVSEKNLKYWETTTIEKEYLKDLEEL